MGHHNRVQPGQRTLPSPSLSPQTGVHGANIHFACPPYPQVGQRVSIWDTSKTSPLTSPKRVLTSHREGKSHRSCWCAVTSGVVRSLQVWRSSLARDGGSLKEGQAAEHSSGHHSAIMSPPSSSLLREFCPTPIPEANLLSIPCL